MQIEKLEKPAILEINSSSTAHSRSPVEGMSRPRPNGDYQESSAYETSDFEDDYSDLNKGDPLRENDSLCSGVHAALLLLGHDMGMQGISCGKGIEHLLLAIITLQE